jgi:hypothetical protein
VAWSRRVVSPAGSDDAGGIGVEFLGGAADQLGALEQFIDAHRGDASAEPVV